MRHRSAFRCWCCGDGRHRVARRVSRRAWLGLVGRIMSECFSKRPPAGRSAARAAFATDRIASVTAVAGARIVDFIAHRLRGSRVVSRLDWRPPFEAAGPWDRSGQPEPALTPPGSGGR